MGWSIGIFVVAFHMAETVNMSQLFTAMFALKKFHVHHSHMIGFVGFGKYILTIRATIQFCFHGACHLKKVYGFGMGPSAELYQWNEENKAKNRFRNCGDPGENWGRKPLPSCETFSGGGDAAFHQRFWVGRVAQVGIRVGPPWLQQMTWTFLLEWTLLSCILFIGALKKFL